MARASTYLVETLKKAANKLKNNPGYQWGHMGACNCGFLAQEVTKLTKREIHEYAMRGHGDWSEQVEAYCPTSQFPMDLLISELISAGFNLQDLINLERLKDEEVLNKIPFDKRKNLRHNSNDDVALYLEKWADVLDEKMQVEIDAVAVPVSR